MKRTVFTLGLLSFVLLSMAQTMNDSIAKEKMTLFQKHHKKIFSTINRTTTLRSAQTTNIQLDSILTTSDKLPSKEVYTYNSNGKVSITTASRLKSNTWVYDEKDQYSYDGNNRVSQYVIQYWDETNSVWENYYKVVFTYNAAGKPLLETAYNWDGTSTWTLDDKELYVYNTNNVLIADTAYSYNSNSWIYRNMTEYAYDSNANLITILNSDWDKANNAWVSAEKIENSYTNNQLVSSMMDGTYNETITYDANGNPIEFITYTWMNNAWSEGFKCQYTYNASYLLSNINMLDDYKTLNTKPAELSYNNMLTKEMSYDEDLSGVWRQCGSNIYYYNNQTNAVFNAKASNLKVTTENGKAVISGLSQGTSLAVYNLQGTAIYNQPAASETVSVNLPARGVYVVKVGAESVKVVY